MPAKSYATHIKAGDLTADYVAGYTWRFTLTVYTEIESINNRPSLDLIRAKISINGVLYDSVPRTSRETVNPETYKNIFTFNYTFSGPSAFVVSFSEVNRNNGILNINGGNSLNVPFYIETHIRVSQLIARNNHSPDLLIPPLDKAAEGKPYYHNPGATDINADSLAFKLVPPKQSYLVDVPNYQYPDGMTMNPVTGDLVWPNPVVGLYNIAYEVEEWRNGIRIGYVLRDMQIKVEPTENEPPVLYTPADTCIIGGDLYSDTVWATEPDGDLVNLYAYSGLLQPGTNQATFELANENPQSSPATGYIRWQTSCNSVRRMPYQIVYKADDVPVNDIPLTDVKSQTIQVYAPPVEVLSIEEGSNSLTLNWRPYICSSASAIEIFRKSCDSSSNDLAICDRNNILLSGYSKIAEVSAINLSYVDDNNGKGLSQGNYYCYVLKVKFPAPGSGESIISEELCGIPGKERPIPLMVSVLRTDINTGKIQIKWSRPMGMASNPYPNGFAYILKRGDGLSPAQFVPVDTIFNIQDTLYIDSLLNTTIPYAYQIELTSIDFIPGISSNHASSVHLTASPGSGKAFLNWKYYVPWKNSEREHIIYRKNPEDSSYSVINNLMVSGKEGSFTDTGLDKDDSVCYVVETIGGYCLDQLPSYLPNRSNEVCIIPSDSSAPCPPVLEISSECKSVITGSNNPFWTPQLSEACNPDIYSYNVYFAQREDLDPALLGSATDTFYIHKDSSSLAGCYHVTAVNLYGIESLPSNKVCSDICVKYTLPNLITPNGDNANDIFRPLPDMLNVESVNFQVYNRWGGRVFTHIGDPLILWGGTSSSGELLADGIYYYSAEVTYKRRLYPGDQNSILKGWVQIISSRDIKE